MGKLFKRLAKFTIAAGTVAGLCYVFKDQIRESKVYQDNNMDEKIQKVKTTIKEKMPKVFDNEDDIEEDDENYRVLTAPDNLAQVVTALEEAGYKAESAEFTRIPENTVEVTDEKVASSILKLMEKLEEHDDVQNVYSNFDIDDDLLQKLE